MQHLQRKEEQAKERAKAKSLPNIYENYYSQKPKPEPEYTFYEISLAKIDLYVDSKLDVNSESGIKWFKWLPDPGFNGMAKIHIVKNDKLIDLKYHIADDDTLIRNYILDEDVSNYLYLLKFAFQNFTETNYINIHEINKNNEFLRVCYFKVSCFKYRKVLLNLF